MRSRSSRFSSHTETRHFYARGTNLGSRLVYTQAMTGTPANVSFLAAPRQIVYSLPPVTSPTPQVGRLCVAGFPTGISLPEIRLNSS